ncbi:DUF2235 domain-containing protein [Sphingosinicella sp. LHD-64]|uniref:DUF2235 domain-containing protein n=1 Tax=Sphingosinicella sp. LHD-64 TaxID=3072139 RepID=UPI0028106456|nr:DUF2235 domain-containing protein [Sphingosinicella sp. LHD-64]MDQ8758258.1 DUF2235 domain-containing protein [Sphingosinicella sp. LHD-64]
MPEIPANPDDHPYVKSIILFSDGTGNSSAKLFKTNVWRLYEAVDLGPTPSPADMPVQVAYYDNGVGTSAFRPLAVLGGIFGFGLRRNILNLYRYACRNYQRGRAQQAGPNETEGDHIYGFGFSRGAFTMRLVIAMIAKEGLVDYADERDLARKSRDAYRAFCSDANPRFFSWPARAARAVRNRLVTGWRKLWRHEVYDRTRNYQPVIRFIGVWDTVAAYGGPFAELTRAIDNWIWPLSMPNYQLSPRVRRARHALAIDDERDAFHPLLWDEVHERALIDSPANQAKPAKDPTRIDRDRLKQVWFTGMHSDVGGGYPDESLSYVSLLWMIDEAKTCGLRILPRIVERIEDLANSFGPIHDSRAGVGAYYRYQPRKIAAYLHPVDTSTLAMRDPAIRDEAGNQKGLLLRAKIHETVIARIISGTDNYAPINLPAEFDVEPPLPQGAVNVPPLVEQRLRERLGVVGPGEVASPAMLARARDRHERQETIWDWVWGRRVVYFLTLFLTLGLAAMPLWIRLAPPAPFFTDGRAWIGSVVNGLGSILPAFARPLTETYSRHPFYFMSFALLIVVLLVTGTYLERMLRDRSRRLWWSAFESDSGDLQGPPTSWLRRWRDRAGYQRSWQVFKWHVMPNLLGPLMLVLLAFGGLSVFTQARLSVLERGDDLCRPTDPARLQPLLKATRDFRTRALCDPTGATVEETVRYAITFSVTEPWSDGALPAAPQATPQGAPAVARNLIGIPLRRVMTARYLQPLIEIRPAPSEQGIFPNVYIFPLSLTEIRPGANIYRAEFTAERSGELMLFANDAVMPFEMGRFRRDFFYTQSAGGNFGSACVTIERLDLTDAERQEADKVTPCGPPYQRPKRLFRPR